jgi:UDP-N-acetylmuramyl pentapeptide phosphotransferase/UDP-N-acetylglucosamine-1-phosphate transferase
MNSSAIAPTEFNTWEHADRFQKEIMMAAQAEVHQAFYSIISGIESPFFFNLILALAVSLAVRWHGRYSLDLDTRGIQKVHDKTVTRTGGIALVAGVLAVGAYGDFQAPSPLLGEHGRIGILTLLVAAIPAFLSGSVEDLTKKVSPRARLCSILVSACLAAWLLGPLPRLDIWGIDSALRLAPVSIFVTVLAVAGVTNSVNIIDGFHGVAGITVAIILSGMAYLAWHAGDAMVTYMAVAGIGATIGFLLLNYPTGRLFMGDGGAYFLGFWAAEIAVLTVARNPGINAWQILAMYAYPVIEVLFSIYRRKILYSALAGAPDRLHLHSLFYRRFARQKISGRYAWTCNAGVACFIGMWIGTATLATVAIGDTIPAAFALVMLQVVLYVAVYMRLVRGHWGHCRNPAVVFGLRPQPRITTAYARALA